MSDKKKSTNEAGEAQVRIEGLKSVILLLLDHVDYTAKNCSQTDMVGAVLPADIIAKARKSLHA